MTTLIFSSIVQHTNLGDDGEGEAVEIVTEGDKTHGHFIVDTDSARHYSAGRKVLITVELADE